MLPNYHVASNVNADQTLITGTSQHSNKYQWSIIPVLGKV